MAIGEQCEMKILYLGDLRSGQTCLMRMRALVRLGHHVYGVDTIEPWMRATWFGRQLQRRLCSGPVVEMLNKSILEAGGEFKPDVVWADKQEYLKADTLVALKGRGARLVHFTPDPYFTLKWKQTALMDEAIKCFDVLVYCKQYERRDYEKTGKPVVYMPLGYCDEIHRPLRTQNRRWKCDIGFLGGWEPYREQIMRAVCGTPLKLNIWGGFWDHLKDGRWSLRRKLAMDQLAGAQPYRIQRCPVLARCIQGGEVYGDDYAEALSSCKIGLGLLRKVCPDQHTTRTFEIPACGSMLLAERTAESSAFFKEGVEAEYFDSIEELVDKGKYYNRAEGSRQRIGAAGRKRCVASGYSYKARMERALQEISALQ